VARHVDGNDRVYYLVIADLMLNGRCVSTIEDTQDLLTEREVVEFVANTDNVQRIIEVNVGENSSRDISEDIARAMIRLPIQLDECAREFLENQLGCDVARQALHDEMAA
jgi:hypothetical protein